MQGCMRTCRDLLVSLCFMLVFYLSLYHMVEYGNQETSQYSPPASLKSDGLKPGYKRSSPIQLYAPKGSPLPNYFTKGKASGLQPEDYSGGVTVFLHHNKAAGSTVKICLSRLQQKGIIQGSRPMVLSSEGRLNLHSMAQKGILLQKNSNDTKYFMGGYSFGMCDYYKSEKNCSYFTFMRDPIDRVISSYFYCKRRPKDQLCGPVDVEKYTLVEWAVYQGSYFFYQLFMHPAYCKGFKLPQSDKTNVEDKLISKNFQTFVKNWDFVRQCWFRQRKYFSKLVSNTEQKDLLDYAINNLENWFAVIGMTEDFSLSLKMLSHVYKIPLEKRCDYVANKGTYKSKEDLEREHNSSIVKSNMRTLLLNSPDAMAALKFDISLYKRGKEIFEQQNQSYILWKTKLKT